MYRLKAIEDKYLGEHPGVFIVRYKQSLFYSNDMDHKYPVYEERLIIDEDSLCMIEKVLFLRNIKHHMTMLNHYDFFVIHMTEEYDIYLLNKDLGGSIKGWRVPD